MKTVEPKSPTGAMKYEGPKYISAVDMDKLQASQPVRPFGGQTEGLQGSGYKYGQSPLFDNVCILAPMQLADFAKKLKATQLGEARVAKAGEGNGLSNGIAIGLNSIPMHDFPQEVVQVLQDVTERSVKEQIPTQDFFMVGINMFAQIVDFFLCSVEPPTAICQFQNATLSRPQPQ
ncbi:hypothetical protein S40285_10394 [Stachybotrys chlorohalonatus IBT 40285]|uniref:Uncharacterized protein n=1 Tax=Stachybotrys chlorohalonatus (strain IBT 40285) TaxID=1283841 RepID=A0A084QCC7_STAC4|nr:hypothetical protein S40285_10394 [Stachybotrys chlorohalonata IBT 40285]